MTFDAAFLEKVAGELDGLARSLDDTGAAVAAALSDASSGLAGLTSAWSGPRPGHVHGLASTYLAETESVPGAIASARETVVRWSAAATEHAGALAVAQARVDLLRFAASRPDATPEASADLWRAIGQVVELSASWKRRCAGFADSLSEAISVIERANGATFVAGEWAWSNESSRLDLGSIVNAVLGLPAAERAAAVASLQAVWSGSDAVVDLLVAAIEEIQARRDAPWNEVLAEHGIPEPGEEGGGSWESADAITAAYGATKEEGGWYLVNMVHDLVADAIAAEASNLVLAPVAVEGQAAGETWVDVVSGTVAVEGAVARQPTDRHRRASGGRGSSSAGDAVHDRRGQGLRLREPARRTRAARRRRDLGGDTRRR